MADRYVVDGSNGWLTLRAATIFWGEEASAAGYRGAVAGRLPDGARTELRWLLNPRVGLPRTPFVVSVREHPGGAPSKQELANLGEWQPVEIVGLPVDATGWDGAYARDDQGPLDGRRAPQDAARRRLEEGQPPIGWATPTNDGTALPDWEPPDIDAYLASILDGRLLAGIRLMLQAEPDARSHDPFALDEAAGAPRLLGRDGRLGAGETAAGRWRPLRMLALGAGSDPYAALALGFGTAVDLGPFEVPIVMVSVAHELTAGGPTIELADVVVPSTGRRPLPPRGLHATRLGRTRPQVTDGWSVDSVGVTWDATPNPAYLALATDDGAPVGHVIARVDPAGRAEILNQRRRPEPVRGWLSFVASRAPVERPVVFADHVVRGTRTHLPPFELPDVLPSPIAYAVAAHDLFGRYSDWALAPHELAGEDVRPPSVVAVTLDATGALVIDWQLDWSDRSPHAIELEATFVGEPAPAWSTRVEFAGLDAPASPGRLAPLGQDMQPVAAFGPEQDGDDVPGVRFYRLPVELPLDLDAGSTRTVEVRARCEGRVHHLSGHPRPFSEWSAPRSASAVDPTPPGAPGVPEAPQWASLPDWRGVSRAVLAWSAAPGAASYVVYEATETAVLAALGRPGPDLARPLVDRLADLRAAEIATPGVRAAFRRLHAEPLPASAATGFEVALPRGSRVIHLYAVIAIGRNGVQGPWPATSRGFIAVAAPRLEMPPRPSLEVRSDGGVRLRVDSPAPVAAFELYRLAADDAPASIDDMGPPFAVLAPAGLAAETSDGDGPVWRRRWYRAVAWSEGDPARGVVAARSPASAAVPALVVPAFAPLVDDVRVNEPGSTDADALVTWRPGAPVAPTPLGPHRVVVEVQGGARHASTHDALPEVDPAALAPPANAAAPRLVRTGGRLAVWLARPAPDTSLSVTLKTIDPLGRVGSAAIVVPPLPPPPQPPPTVTSIAPDVGHPGDAFTITGTRLVLHEGEDVQVVFVGPRGADQEGQFRADLVQPTLPTAVTALVPDPQSTNDHEIFAVVLIRSDGSRAAVIDDFFLAIL